MASTTEVNISENVRFFGALMGTPGITEANNEKCNNYISRLLDALEPFVQDHIDEATKMIKMRKEEMERIAEEPNLIIAPTGHDMNHLNID
jgi:hypothetical protein